MARRALEEKAEQLSLTSKYKSRVPGQHVPRAAHAAQQPADPVKLLAENPRGNLTDKQVEFAQTIHAAGTDLLALINDILDLSKIESGTVTLEVGERRFARARRARRAHLPPGRRASKELDFAVELDAGLPRAMRTDAKRLQQVLRNLLSNAFKFTERGRRDAADRRPREGCSRSSLPGRPVDRASRSATPASASAEDKQRIIFEAFQQADGTTSRKYGGTGLGLAISREIARLLGGEIVVSSTPGGGSDLHAVPADRAAGQHGGLAGPPSAPEGNALGHAGHVRQPSAAMALSASADDRARHRHPATTSCSSSRTTRCSRRSFSSWRASRASRA